MEKTKQFDSAYFNADIIKSALDTAFPSGDLLRFRELILERGTEKWSYDNDLEFYADYRKDHDWSWIKKTGNTTNNIERIQIVYHRFSFTSISVTSKTRGEIENIFEIFEKSYESSIIKPKLQEEERIIFIGHGGNSQWRDLKDHLADKHGYKIEAFETGARAGHTIKDILEEMSSKSSFALLVMT